jgi:hypothetical protein
VFIVSFFSIYFGASVTTNWYQSLGFIWLGESVRVRVRVVQKYCSKAVEHCSSERSTVHRTLLLFKSGGALFIGGTLHLTLLLFINTVHRVLFTGTVHGYCFKITGRKVLSTDNIVV